jgi:hypothetical protein
MGAFIIAFIIVIVIGAKGVQRAVVRPAPQQAARQRPCGRKGGLRRIHRVAEQVEERRQLRVGGDEEALLPFIF